MERMRTMWETETYTTPEGFELAKPLLLPDVHDLGELVTVVRPWDYATMSHRGGVVPRPDLVPEPVDVDGSHLGPYMSIRRDGRTSGYAVVPTDTLVEALRGQLITWDGDPERLGLKVIEHKERGRALVVVEYSRIIGSRWVAYVRTDTLPADES